MECQNITLRKLALLWFGFMLKNPKSKIYMSEKCGLGISPGRYFLTRTKYLNLNLNGEALTKSFLKYLYRNDKSQKYYSSTLFWYYDIKAFSRN